MARLDSVIERLFKESGTDIVFETGASAILHNDTGEVVVVRQKLTASQIIGAISEILPSELKGKFPGEGELSFQYPSSSGVITVQFKHEEGKASARLLPGDGDSGGLELASPADMLGMAAAAAGVPAAAPPPSVARPGAPRPGTTSTPPAANGSPAGANINVIKPPAPFAGTAAPGAKAEIPVPKPSPDAGAAMGALLSYMLERKASDLHMSSHNVPMLRIDGDITPIVQYGKLEPDRLKAMLWSIASERNQKQWEECKDTDFAHETDQARFRVNVFADRMGIGSVMRQIPNQIRTAEDLGLSKAILDLCFLTKGLVVVTGPTGSGKSTTLAAMIDFINRNREDHIITIEDPIEFVHPNKKCLVNQREIGVHTQSFKHSLRAALREDPDIVLVGEMRDLETIAIAIETAETGHLVFGTLHTTTASSTVDRLIDQFPSDRQSQIRTMLSESLKGVVAQTLCKKIGGGRVAALEVLLGVGSVANLIREAKTFQLPSIMQTGKAAGMVTLNDALFEHVKAGRIEPLEAYMKSVGKSEMKGMLERAGLKFELPTGG